MLRLAKLVNPSIRDVEQFLNTRQQSFVAFEKRVQDIVNKVKHEGDKALSKFVSMFEKFPLKFEDIRVKPEEFEQIVVDSDFEQIVSDVIKDVTNFHIRQKESSSFYTTVNGSILGEMVVPIESVGIYVPGGKASYFSTLIMCAVPAIIAGVERIVVVTPPDERGKVSDYVISVAKMLGIREIYKMGGAHAIAALAYGTESIKRVDKIVGPGGVFVSLAKKVVFGDVGIDSVAGPSELVVIADESVPLNFVVADFLSQAEHDENAMSVLITTSRMHFDEIDSEVERQLKELTPERRETVKMSLKKNGIVMLAESIQMALEISNVIAPEHLELLVENPFELVGKVKSAGSVFMGKYSCESVGDYGAGPNHVLPTYGSARFSSGLRVSDFLKRVFLTYFSKKDFFEKSEIYSKMARWEGFEAHAKAVDVRRDSL
ncbi:histidinol dehydrogenase [Fervidobacterium sp.]